MLLDHLRDRRVVVVGGKGGVGKTSVSAAAAFAQAERGGRVLLVSTDPAHNLGHLFGKQVGDSPTSLATPGTGRLDGLEIDPDRTLRRHFDEVQELMEQLLPERLHGPARRHLASARHAPGSQEAAMLERVAEAAQRGLEEYDLVVFDTAPTGHTLHLLSLPEQMGSWTESLLRSRSRSEQYSATMRSLISGRREGPGEKEAALRRTLIARRERFARLHRILTQEAAFVLVTVAEPMPAAESLELSAQLHARGMALAALVVNRRSPAEAGQLLAERRRHEETQIARLRQALPGLPLEQIPLLPGDLTGAEGVSTLAALLG